jgi:hypothetical protein
MAIRVTGAFMGLVPLLELKNTPNWIVGLTELHKKSIKT